MTWEVIAGRVARPDDEAMTTTDPTSSRTSTAPPVDGRRLLDDPVRRILAVDAGVCLVAGGLLLAAAGPLARSAELASPTVLWLLGGFVLLLGIDLAVTARAPRRWARLGAVVTGFGDLVWVAASLVVVLSTGLPGWMSIAVLGQAALVLVIAGAKRAALQQTAA